MFLKRKKFSSIVLLVNFGKFFSKIVDIQFEKKYN